MFRRMSVPHSVSLKVLCLALIFLSVRAALATSSVPTSGREGGLSRQSSRTIRLPLKSSRAVASGRQRASYFEATAIVEQVC